MPGARDSDAMPEPHERPDIALAADPPKDVDLLRAAARLSVDLGLPFLEKPAKTGHDMLLVVTPGRVDPVLAAAAVAAAGAVAASADSAAPTGVSRCRFFTPGGSRSGC